MYACTCSMFKCSLLIFDFWKGNTQSKLRNNLIGILSFPYEVFKLATKVVIIVKSTKINKIKENNKFKGMCSELGKKITVCINVHVVCFQMS